MEIKDTPWLIHFGLTSIMFNTRILKQNKWQRILGITFKDKCFRWNPPLTIKLCSCILRKYICYLNLKLQYKKLNLFPTNYLIWLKWNKKKMMMQNSFLGQWTHTSAYCFLLGLVQVQNFSLKLKSLDQSRILNSHITPTQPTHHHIKLKINT